MSIRRKRNDQQDAQTSQEAENRKRQDFAGSGISQKNRTSQEAAIRRKRNYRIKRKFSKNVNFAESEIPSEKPLWRHAYCSRRATHPERNAQGPTCSFRNEKTKTLTAPNSGPVPGSDVHDAMEAAFPANDTRKKLTLHSQGRNGV